MSLPAQFVAACCRSDQHQLLIRYGAQLRWAAKIYDTRAVAAGYTDESMAELIPLVLDYDKTHNHTPSFTELKDFILLSGHEPTELGYNQESTGGLINELIAAEEAGEITVNETTSAEPLVTALIQEARDILYIYTYKRGIDHVLGNVKVRVGRSEQKRTSTIEDSVDYVRRCWAMDLANTKQAVTGPLNETSETLTAELNADLEAARSGADRKLVFGIEPLDNNIHITPRIRPFVTIAAHTHVGKSTFLRSIAYHSAKAGLNIAFFSKEEQPEELRKRFAWLHGKAYENDFILPPYQKWERGEVTDADVTHVTQIVEDIAARKTLSGIIDIQLLRSWDELVSHLEVNDAKYKYDAVFIDYLTDIPTPGIDARFRNQEIVNILGKAQALTRDFQSRGIILVTPTQTNRESEKAAKKAEPGEKKLGIMAVRQFSELEQLEDVQFTLFSSDSDKPKRLIELDTPKVRGGGVRPTGWLKIDPRTLMVKQKGEWNLTKSVDDVPYDEQAQYNRTTDIMQQIMQPLEGFEG